MSVWTKLARASGPAAVDAISDTPQEDGIQPTWDPLDIVPIERGVALASALRRRFLPKHIIPAYHGTSAVYDLPDVTRGRGMGDPGHFVTTNPYEAEVYATMGSRDIPGGGAPNIRPYMVRAENPINVMEFPTKEQAKNLSKAAKKLGYDPEPFKMATASPDMNAWNQIATANMKAGVPYRKRGEFLREAGYDLFDDNSNTAFVVQDPEQLVPKFSMEGRWLEWLLKKRNGE